MNSRYCCVRNVDCCRCRGSLIKPNVSIKLQSSQAVSKKKAASSRESNCMEGEMNYET